MNARSLALGWVIACGACATGCSERSDGTRPPEDAGSSIRLDAATPDAARAPDGAARIDAGGPPGDAGPSMGRMFVLNDKARLIALN